MPGHYNPRKRDAVIDFVYFWLATLDSRRAAVLVYFKTTPVRTIITNFLAYVAVFGILLFPVFMAILAVMIYS